MFVEIIEKLLKEQKLQKKDFLLELNLNKNSFSVWKTRGTVPSGAVLQRIADYFGVSVDYLLGKGTNEYAHTQNEKPPENGELPDKNVVITIGRDGTYSKKRLSDEQIKALQAIIDQMPDAPDDI